MATNDSEKSDDKRASEYFKELEAKAIEAKRRAKESQAEKKSLTKSVSSIGKNPGIRSSGSVRGISRVSTLASPENDEWSDLGLLFGSGFKHSRGRNLFPSSKRDRTLHPQEKAEISYQQNRIALFGITNPFKKGEVKK